MKIPVAALMLLLSSIYIIVRATKMKIVMNQNNLPQNFHFESSNASKMLMIVWTPCNF